MNENEFVLQSGALKVKPDRRDFDFHKSHPLAAAFSASDLPESYNADAGLTMPNQNLEGLPMGCTGETTADLCVDEDQVAYPGYAADLYNNTPPYDATQGRDIRAALKTATQRAPQKLGGGFGPKRTAYFNVQASGPLDSFDAIRIALYATASEHRSVSIGTPWFPVWQPVNYGNGRLGSDAILPMPPSLSAAGLGWHNWKISGWKTINGVPYLIGKSWQGAGYGDKGFHYISRDVLNAVMTIYGTGAFTISKVAPATIQTIDFGIAKLIWSLIQSILSQFSNPLLNLPSVQVPTVQPPAPVVPPPPKYDWSTPEAARHSVRVICDEEGLTVAQKNLLCATVQCESGFKTNLVHPNIKNGITYSTDYGICQWNDYYHGKEITPEEAINNPEKAVRLMCQYWKRGQSTQWVCFSAGLYKKYMT